MSWNRSICEACGRETVDEVIESEQPDELYRICSECAIRLRTLALRPIEWFNLAAIHGPWKFYLHDDFYDQHGVAWQPKSDGYSIDGLPAPTLSKGSQSLERLIDYCITRLWLGETEYAAFDAFEGNEILDVVRKRARHGNHDLFTPCLNVAANVIGHEASDWVRDQYRRPGASMTWRSAATP